MHLVGRRSEVRVLGVGGITPPYTLTRQLGPSWDVEMAPHLGREWDEAIESLWRSRHGIDRYRGAPWWLTSRFDRRHAVALTSEQIMRIVVSDPEVNALTQTTLALNSAYTYSTQGNAIACRINPFGDLTLNNVYYYITAFAGTQANINDINIELRNHATNLPGTTLHASATDDPSLASIPTWRNVSGFSFAISADTIVWGIVADADGGVTDFITVLRNNNVPVTLKDDYLLPGFQTTGGWSTAATAANQPAGMVLRFSNGQSVGSPFTAFTNTTSSTNQRGFFIDGLVADLSIRGLFWTSSLANSSQINLWTGSGAGPGGSPTQSGTSRVLSQAANPVVSGRAFTVGQTLLANTIYRLVLAFSSAVTVGRWQIGVGADANLRAAMLGGGGLYYTEANGTTDWSNESTSEFPPFGILVENQVAAAAPAPAGHGALSMP